MEKLLETKNKIVFSTDMNLALANALRRSVGEVPILAVEEVDIYKNDSALYDEVLAHRIGLVPLKNQKVKDGDFIELKLSVKASGEMIDVLSGEFGELSVYDKIPLTILEKNQQVEIVAKARQGRGVEHSRFSPGLVYYRNLNKVKISREAESHVELAEVYPHCFSVDSGKLKIKDVWSLDLEVEDLKEFEGIEVTPTDEIVYAIESWGQISPDDIFKESVKALDKNLNEVLKALK